MTAQTLIAAAVVGLAAHAHAQVTFEILGYGFATGLSADGTVVVGNDESYTTFRWTRAGGQIDLGRGSFAALGRGAGAPDVSSDGTRISASILDSTGQFVTPGLWTQGSGWQDLMPPLPPTGGLLDLAYGSAWGISGDGNTVVGLYWRPGQSDGLAHAMKWTHLTGAEDLGSGGRNSRANDANFDGSVVVGWDEEPGFGNWQPAVWVNGVRTVLSVNGNFTSANAVSDDGTVVVGQSYDATTNTRIAALWRWDGTNWNEEHIGVLPGTFAGFGQSIANEITPDGKMVVGYNPFDFGPGSPATGFMWTSATGMVNIEKFLKDNGVTVDPLFDIHTLTGVSDDGRTLVGTGYERLTLRPKWFLIHIGCYADCDQSTGAGVLDIFDFLCFQDAFVNGDPYACDCDTTTGAGVCDIFDFLCFQDGFVGGCS
jgi:uncharacterized membrane protein